MSYSAPTSDRPGTDHPLPHVEYCRGTKLEHRENRLPCEGPTCHVNDFILTVCLSSNFYPGHTCQQFLLELCTVNHRIREGYG